MPDLARLFTLVIELLNIIKRKNFIEGVLSLYDILILRCLILPKLRSDFEQILKNGERQGTYIDL